MYTVTCTDNNTPEVVSYNFRERGPAECARNFLQDDFDHAVVTEQPDDELDHCLTCNKDCLFCDENNIKRK